MEFQLFLHLLDPLPNLPLHNSAVPTILDRQVQLIQALQDAAISLHLIGNQSTEDLYSLVPYLRVYWLFLCCVHRLGEMDDFGGDYPCTSVELCLELFV